MVIFKALVLCELYNLADEPFEYQVRDRLSFMRFLGLGLEDPVPDATTVWPYREQLLQAGVVDALFGAFAEEPGLHHAPGGTVVWPHDNDHPEWS